MIGNDRAANQFLESIRANLEDERKPEEKTTSHVVINRAVRCTIIVGQQAQPLPSQRRRAQRKT